MATYATNMFTIDITPKRGFGFQIHLYGLESAKRTARLILRNGFRIDSKKVRANRIAAVSVKCPDGQTIPVVA